MEFSFPMSSSTTNELAIYTKPNLLHVFGGMPTGGVRSTLFNVLRFQPLNKYNHILIDLSYRAQITFPHDVDDIDFSYINLNASTEGGLDLVQSLRHYIHGLNVNLIVAWGDWGNYLCAKAISNVPDAAQLICRMSSARDLEAAKRPGSPVSPSILRETACLSPHMNCVIYTSSEVCKVHEDIGIQPQNSKIIYNGVCTQTFVPKTQNYKLRQLIKEFCIWKPKDVIGHAARFSPFVKNHYGFLLAAKALIQERPHMRFVMCGNGVDKNNTVLSKQIRELGLQGFIFTLGHRIDMPVVYHLADI